MPTSDEWLHLCTPTGKTVKQSKILPSKPEHCGCSTKMGPEPLPKSDVSMPRDVIIKEAICTLVPLEYRDSRSQFCHSTHSIICYLHKKCIVVLGRCTEEETAPKEGFSWCKGHKYIVINYLPIGAKPNVLQVALTVPLLIPLRLQTVPQTLLKQISTLPSLGAEPLTRRSSPLVQLEGTVSLPVYIERKNTSLILPSLSQLL